MGGTASNTGFATSDGGEIKITVSELSTDTAANTSQVQVTGTIINDNSSATASNSTVGIPCSMSGTDSVSGTYSYTGADFYIQLGPGKSKVFIQQTFTVAHASDGTGSADFTVRYGNSETAIFGTAASIAVTLTLTTIVQAADAPGDPAFTNIMPTSLTATWTAPSSDGGGTITSYRITYYFGDAAVGAANYAYAGGLTANLTGFTPGQDYTFTVAAYNGGGSSGGYSPESGAVTVSMPAACWMRVGGDWVVGNPYVRTGGVWKMAVPWVRVAGVWQQTH